MPKLGVSEHKIVKSSKKGDFRKISGMSQGGGAAGPPDFGGSEILGILFSVKPLKW